MKDHQFQLDIERMFNNNQLMRRLKNEFRDMGFGPAIETNGIPLEFGFSLLVQIYLHKRTSPGTMIGILRRHFEDKENPTQEAADMLTRAMLAGLAFWDNERKQIVVRWHIKPEVQRELDLFQYPLPMVIPPKEVRNNTETGYLTYRRSVILKDNHTEDDVCLDHINRVNQTALRVNTDTARMVRNKWRNLDRPKEGELVSEYQKRVKAFEKFDTDSREVIDFLATVDEQFWLTHSFDKRGRTYCNGHHLNYQGSEWQKAIIEFAEGEIVDG